MSKNKKPVKKRILFVINTMGRGGAERALLSLLGCIRREEYDVDLLSILPRGELFGQVPRRVNIINNDWSPEPVLGREAKKYLRKTALKGLLNKGYVFRKAIYFARYLCLQIKHRQVRLKNLLWKALADNAQAAPFEYDLAVAYLEGASTYYVAERVRAKKKAAFVHTEYDRAGYIKEIDQPHYDKMDRIFCVSKSLRESFCGVFPEYNDKTFVMHNIVRPSELFEKAKAGAGFDDGFEGTRLLTAARLDYEKGIDVSIDAFARLKAAGGYEHVRWYVLGEGAERGALEKRIKERGLESDFVLCGAKDNPYPYFAGCDIYVQSSRREGRSITLTEAGIFNKPVITSRVMSADEQVADGETGIIFDLSVDNLLRALKTLLDSDRLREKMVSNLEKISKSDTTELDILLSLSKEEVCRR